MALDKAIITFQSDFGRYVDALNLAEREGIRVCYDNDCAGSCSDIDVIAYMINKGYTNFSAQDNGKGSYKIYATPPKRKDEQHD